MALDKALRPVLAVAASVALALAAASSGAPSALADPSGPPPTTIVEAPTPAITVGAAPKSATVAQTVTIGVALTDTFMNPLPDVTVTFAVTGNATMAPPATGSYVTDARGLVTANLTDTTAETVTVTAVAAVATGVETESVDVTFTPGPFSASESTFSVQDLAVNDQCATIRYTGPYKAILTARDANGNLLTDLDTSLIQFAASASSGGTVSVSAPVENNGDGTYSVTISATGGPQATASVTYDGSAKVPDVSGKTDLPIIFSMMSVDYDWVSPATTVSVDHSQFSVGQTATVTATYAPTSVCAPSQAMLEFDIAGGVTVAAVSGSGTVRTNADGTQTVYAEVQANATASITLTSDTTVVASVAVTSLGSMVGQVNGSPVQVAFTSSQECATSTFTVSPAVSASDISNWPLADGADAYTGTVTAVDCGGTRITDLNPDDFAFTPSSSNVRVSDVTNNDDGTYSAQFTSVVAGSDFTVSATYQGVAIKAPGSPGSPIPFKAEPPVAGGVLPNAVDNSELKYFPPIGNQGAVGACTTFATVYYTATYMAAMARDIDVKAIGDSAIFSPAFLWEYGIPGNVPMTMGSMTLDQYPWDSSITQESLGSKQASPEMLREAYQNRAESELRIDNPGTAESQSLIKQYLADGYVFAASIDMSALTYRTIDDNPSPGADNSQVGEAIVTSDSTDPPDHSITLVGYNDDIWVDLNGDGVVEPNELGAYKLANSWGTGYGNDGFIWLSYSSASALWGYVHTYLFADTPHVPELMGQFDVSLPSDYALAYLGWAPADKPDAVVYDSQNPFLLWMPTGSGTWVVDFSDIIAENGLDLADQAYDFYIRLTPQFYDDDTNTLAVTSYKLTDANGVLLADYGGSLPATVAGPDYAALEITYGATARPVTLDSIAVSTPPTKTSYTVGDTLDLTGMTVTATYSDSSTADVTTDVTIDLTAGTALDTSGTQTVTVTYTDNGIAKTATFNVTVAPVALTGFSAAQSTFTVTDMGVKGCYGGQYGPFTGTLTARDAQGNLLTSLDTSLVGFTASSPDVAVSSATNNGDGTYTATFTASVGSFTASVSYDGSAKVADSSGNTELRLFFAQYTADPMVFPSAVTVAVDHSQVPVGQSAIVTVAYNSTSQCDPRAVPVMFTVGGGGAAVPVDPATATVLADGTIMATAQSDGTVSVAVSSASPGVVPVDVQYYSFDGPLPATGSPTQITFTASTGLTYGLTVSPVADPSDQSTVVQAGGSYTATVTVRDSAGRPILGAVDASQVVFTPSSTNVSVSKVTDNHDGTYTALLTSKVADTNLGTGKFTVWATVDGVPAIAPDGGAALPIPFRAGAPAAGEPVAGELSAMDSTFSVSPSNPVVANGTSGHTGTVTAKNAAGGLLTDLNPADFTFSPSSADVEVSLVTNNGDGTYSAQLTSTVADATDTVYANYQGSAIAGGAPQPIPFVAGAPVAGPLICADGRQGTHLSAYPTSLVVGNDSFVSAFVTDANCNPVQGVQISFGQSGGAQAMIAPTGVPYTTNADGVAVARYRGYSAGVATFSASIVNTVINVGSTDVTWSDSATLPTATLTYDSVANQATVAVVDAFGAPVVSVEVTLTVDGGASIPPDWGSSRPLFTGLDGKAVFDVTPPAYQCGADTSFGLSATATWVGTAMSSAEVSTLTVTNSPLAITVVPPAGACGPVSSDGFSAAKSSFSVTQEGDPSRWGCIVTPSRYVGTLTARDTQGDLLTNLDTSRIVFAVGAEKVAGSTQASVAVSSVENEGDGTYTVTFTGAGMGPNSGIDATASVTYNGSDKVADASGATDVPIPFGVRCSDPPYPYAGDAALSYDATTQVATVTVLSPGAGLGLGSPLPGATVTFTVSGTTIGGATSATVTTDAQGVAAVSVPPPAYVCGTTVAWSLAATVTANGMSVLVGGSPISLTVRPPDGSCDVASPPPTVDVTNGSQITGTGTPGSTIQVTDAAGNVVPGCENTTVDSTGHFKCAPTTPVKSGTSLTVTQVDPAGASSTSVPVTVSALQIGITVSSAQAGQQQTVTGSGFNPGERVDLTLQSTPIDMGYQTADANGTVTFSFAVPQSLGAGTHTATLTGAQSGSVLGTFKVVAPAGGNAGNNTPSVTVNSGGSVVPSVAGLAAASGLLGLAGVWAGVAALRRRTAEG